VGEVHDLRRGLFGLAARSRREVRDPASPLGPRTYRRRDPRDPLAHAGLRSLRLARGQGLLHRRRR